jgi:hypothetical protein
MEVADSIEEVKTTCNFCNNKAVFNLKHVNGKADCTGPAIQLGAEEKYFPTCFACYRRSLKDANQTIKNWELDEILSTVDSDTSIEEIDTSLENSLDSR